MNDWSDDDRFWEAMTPALCAPNRVARADADVSAILASVPLRPGASVLDLGCGPGAHAIALARQGHRVTGVDRSRKLLEHARASAEPEALAVEWIEADMRDFLRPGAFDLILSLYTSFGYFDDRQNRRVLENLRASLGAGGALLIDVTGRETAARHWQERRWQEVEGVLYLERCRSADDWSAVESHWIVVRGGARAEFRAKLRLYSGTELRELLVSVGFPSVRLAGDLGATTAYGDSAERLVAIARTAEA